MPEQRRRFSPQFKAEAVQMVVETGRPIAAVARDLGIHDGTLGSAVRRWPAVAGPPLDLSALAGRRDGDDWVSRRVAGNGIICVAWQQVSAGKYRAGEIAGVHVTPRLLEIWAGNDLVKTVVRASSGEVRKKHVSKPGLPRP